MIDENDENPYYDDTIMKYMARPHLPEFENLTYPQYFERYSITPSSPSSTNRQIYRDDLNNYIVKRSKEIIIRYRFLKIEDGELYFYQQLLLKVSTRSELDYKNGPNETYREKFLSLFPNYLTELQNQIVNTHQSQITYFNNQFIEMLDRLLQSLNNQLTTNISEIIRVQLDNLKILPHVYPETAMLELPHDQYHVLSTISMYMGKSNNRKWPYYFITGSAGTGKSYIINMIKNNLDRKQSNYILLAPTGVAAQNIDGKTIHSRLQIKSTQGGFQTKVFTDKELRDDLINVETLIIDEISMVSDKLLDFISNLFASLHNNALAFGGINVIVVGDLAQLPPITGQPVFNATVWKLFYPLFLKISQ